MRGCSAESEACLLLRRDGQGREIRIWSGLPGTVKRHFSAPCSLEFIQVLSEEVPNIISLYLIVSYGILGLESFIVPLIC